MILKTGVVFHPPGASPVEGSAALCSAERAIGQALPAAVKLWQAGAGAFSGSKKCTAYKNVVENKILKYGITNAGEKHPRRRRGRGEEIQILKNHEVIEFE